MSRITLPDRRVNYTREIEFHGSIFTVCVGFDRAGSPKEVFADSANGGSAMAAIISDACVIISIALQHGISPANLGKSLGREPDPIQGEGADRAASPIGRIVEVVVTPLDRVLADIREGA
ncbi:MAG: hypothetical protein COB08_000770 [Rhodobacteraceae bacterium]|nr:hypothetical protein [Paracoccaceae bacterium]